MSLVVDEHREYLTDAVRLEAFRSAVRERVRPGEVIADLGAGTGVLGLLACQAGAARVYAIESTGMIEVARGIARANNYGDCIVHIREHSMHVSLPEPVDGIVCDQIGHFGFEAGLFELMADARRWLKPGGWILPQVVHLEIAPVEEPEIRRRIAFWGDPILGMDFRPAHAWAANTGYPKQLEPGQLLAPPVEVARVETLTVSTSRLSMEASFLITRGGTLDGIGGWFRAALSPSVELTNAPGAPSRLARRNVVLPVTPPVPVSVGDRLDVRLQVLPADLVATWRGTVHSAAGETRFSHSTLGGMLITPEDLRRLDPGVTPRLTSRGLARRTVLELCNGARPLGDIERELLARHPELFRTAADASVFVAEVVSRYTE